jgi:hypothetical protein
MEGKEATESRRRCRAKQREKRSPLRRLPRYVRPDGVERKGIL